MKKDQSRKMTEEELKPQDKNMQDQMNQESSVDETNATGQLGGIAEYELYEEEDSVLPNDPADALPARENSELENDEDLIR